MAELSGQASGPRSPHTRYPRVIDSERGLYRQVFCRDKAIDNSGHVVFSSWSHFFGVIQEMPIYSNGTKLGRFRLSRSGRWLKPNFMIDSVGQESVCLFVVESAIIPIILIRAWGLAHRLSTPTNGTKPRKALTPPGSKNQPGSHPTTRTNRDVQTPLH